MQADGVWTVLGSILVSVFFIKNKYYLIWSLSEAVVTASGFSYDPDSKTPFRGVSHFDYVGVELSSSMKVNIDNWNVSVQRWLKECVYFRLYPLAELKAKKALQ
jgi:hypothetical protein